jgi:methylated-DNA-[protein]-cysteine S-methyltransferase
MLYTTYCTSPVGTLEISSNEAQITSILFVDTAKKPSPRRPATEIVPSVITTCMHQLEQYFDGSLKEFTVPYLLEGTPFQLQTWNELCNIPYGTTITYGEQAKRMNNLKAIRAVGTCNGNNPISIIVPCHRVIGANGSLTGYGGGLWVKEFLLKLERNNSEQKGQLSIF